MSPEAGQDGALGTATRGLTNELADVSAAPVARPYLDPGRAQLLDLLQHLIEYSALLLLVSGPQGRGKSTLAAELRALSTDRHRVCEVEPDSDLTTDLLLRRLATCLGLSEEAGRDAAALERALVEQGQQAVVLVDDAQRLPPATLALLAGFAAADEDAQGKPVRVVLFADENLRADVALAAERVHRLSIAAFTPAQTAEYLEYRLQGMGEPPQAARVRAAVKSIHRGSGGNPGAIEAIMSEMLEGAPGRPAWLPRGFALPGRPILIAGVAAVGVLAAGLWVLSSGGESSAPHIVLSIPDAEPIGPAARAPTVVPHAPIEGPARIQEATPGADRFPDALIAQAPREQAAPAPGSAVDAPPEAGSRPQTELPSAPLPTVTLPAAAARAQATDMPVAQAPEVTPDPEVAAPPTSVDPDVMVSEAPPRTLRDDAWLAQRNPEHYTLQILAAGNLEALKAFVARKGLEGEAAILPGTRGDSPWYTLIVGEFADRAAAQQAAARLRPQLDEAPWLRRIGGLQAAGQVPAAAAAAAAAVPAPSKPAAAPAAAPAKPAEPQVTPAAATAPPSQTPAASSGRGAGWLWAQDPRSYTLQLMGSRNETVLRETIARHRIERHATYFTTEHQGRPWYVLIYGSYPDAQSARAAAAALPQGLRDTTPWPRAFADVQQSVTLE